MWKNYGDYAIESGTPIWPTGNDVTSRENDLFRRNWLQNIKLNWGSIKKITCDLDSMLSRHQSIFKDELSTISGIKTKFFVKTESKLKFFKLCQVPYALKEPLNKN